MRRWLAGPLLASLVIGAVKLALHKDSRLPGSCCCSCLAHIGVDW